MLKNLRLRESDIKYLLQGMGLLLAVSLIFYNTPVVSLIFSPFLLVYCKNCRKEEKRRREEQLAQQFKDGITAVAFALGVGYSIENSFAEAGREMYLLHGGESPIVREFDAICVRLRRNENIEDVLEAFAQSSGLEDVRYFAEVFRVAKRSGGDLIAISRRTAQIISDKLEVRKEIATIVSGKKMEQRVMNIVPFGIIVYLRLTSPEFIMPLYGNIVGVTVMTACLLVYLAAYVWGKKITDIRV